MKTIVRIKQHTAEGIKVSTSNQNSPIFTIPDHVKSTKKQHEMERKSFNHSDPDKAGLNLPAQAETETLGANIFDVKKSDDGFHQLCSVTGRIIFMLHAMYPIRVHGRQMEHPTLSSYICLES